MRQASSRGTPPRRSVTAAVTAAVAAGVIIMSGCSPSGAQDAQAGELETEVTADREAGGAWAPLFDGSSLAGWRGILDEAVPEGHWTVEDGTIRKIASANVPTAPDGQPLVGGDIMTIDTYSSFELSFEWKVAPGANSGIKYNVSREMSIGSEPVTAALGFEYQILDDDLHPDAANGENRQAGALYDMIPPDPGKVLRPVGEFNEGRIVFDRGHGEHWLNGAKVLEYDVGSDEFNVLLARSKYDPIPGFADLRSGHIVLQDHSDDVWYRNIRIKVIER